MPESTDANVFTLPPGADFPAELWGGLRERLADQPPEAMGRVTLYVNTERMRSRLLALMTEGAAGFLPRIALVSALADDPALALPPPPAANALRRRLDLAQLIGGLLEHESGLAPLSARFDLAEELSVLLDEMQAEGVPPERISALDVAEHSAHWARSQRFLEIVAPLYADVDVPGPNARLRLAAQALAQQWSVTPPDGPVIVAGSTGSRGPTAILMRAVARLPQGAVVLPGFDSLMPPDVWESLDAAHGGEDHPQFRFCRLLRDLGQGPGRLRPWRAATPPDPERNRLVSLALRPAPVTDRWRIEGQDLPLLDAGPVAGLTLIEAPTPRHEAQAIALILRGAAESGRRAALITPDRNLGRRVAAALDRWGIRPDDSAGRPLSLSPPGRFLRLVMRLMAQPCNAELLLALLKHPLASTGQRRGEHLLLTRNLDVHLRRNGPMFPVGEDLRRWATAQPAGAAPDWADWIARILDHPQQWGPQPLATLASTHRALAEALARGFEPDGAGALWDEEAGKASLALMEALAKEATESDLLSPNDYCRLFESLAAAESVRETVAVHPDIMIWGTLEARVQGADLVVLGGLNDGIWPTAPAADPWLNRRMRLEAGLLLPERQIGLSAHDFQQAIAAPQVVLTRALHDGEAETVPSRWLNRLTHLLKGLPERNGPDALDDMRSRGQIWLNHAAALERPGPDLDRRRANRPSPRPPVSVRPRQLSLTDIEKLIRDPYEIYARKILRLHPLDPLFAPPDARDTGVALHAIVEEFAKTRPQAETLAEARTRLGQISQTVLAREVPFPATRVLLLSLMESVAEGFLALDREQGWTPLGVEMRGKFEMPEVGFTLTGRLDRVDANAQGHLRLIDFKTGDPPSEKQQAYFSKQLLLAALLVQEGGLPDIGPAEVAEIRYVGLNRAEKFVATAITPELIEQHRDRLTALIAAYTRRQAGYTALRAVFETRRLGDFSHLARFGEWSLSDPAQPVDVGPVEGES